MPIKKMITFSNRFLIIIMQFCSMLKKLQQKWKVDGKNLILILISFAIGGSVCARLGEKIIALFQLEKNFFWYFLYLIIVTILWPICVIVISIPFGQFVFFRSYVKKIFDKTNIHDYIFSLTLLKFKKYIYLRIDSKIK